MKHAPHRKGRTMTPNIGETKTMPLAVFSPPVAIATWRLFVFSEEEALLGPTPGAVDQCTGGAIQGEPHTEGPADSAGPVVDGSRLAHRRP